MYRNIYFRRVKGSNMHIIQLICLSKVFTLSKNRGWTNGEVHGWRIEKKLRKATNL